MSVLREQRDFQSRRTQRASTMQASGIKSFSPHFGGIANDERVLARRAEFIDCENDSFESNGRNTHASEDRACRDSIRCVRSKVSQRRDGVTALVEQNAREP